MALVTLEPGSICCVAGWRGLWRIERHRDDEGEVDVFGPLGTAHPFLRAASIARLVRARKADLARLQHH